MPSESRPTLLGNPDAGEDEQVTKVSGSRPPPGAFLREDPENVAPLPEVEGFRILREIGRGGMAVVYEAVQESVQRPVALKLMNPELAENQEFVRRFEREARAVGQLNHPNVVHLHDLREAGGRLFLVLEYVEGYSLRDVLDETGGRLDVPSSCHLLEKVAEGLCFVHDAGTMHRDVKPENILLGQGGTVKLSDFGLAGLIDRAAEARLTRENVIMGTVDYMAPEQREDTRSVDHRADLYAFGVMAYELLTGHLPQGAWKPAGRLVEGIDPRLDELILRCLERDPEQRLRSAREAVEVLQAVERDRLSVPSTPPPGPEEVPWGESSSESIDLALERLASRSHPTLLTPAAVTSGVHPVVAPRSLAGFGSLGVTLVVAVSVLLLAPPASRLSPTPRPPEVVGATRVVPTVSVVRPEPAPAPPVIVAPRPPTPDPPTPDPPTPSSPPAVRAGSLLLQGTPARFRYRAQLEGGQGPLYRAAAGLRLDELEPGSYQVEAEAEGYLSWRQPVEVRAGRDVVVEVRLRAVPSPSPSPSPSPRPQPRPPSPSPSPLPPPPSPSPTPSPLARPPSPSPLAPAPPRTPAAVVPRLGEGRLEAITLEANPGGVRALLFLADVGLVATGGVDNQVRLFDPVAARPYGDRLGGHANDVLALAAGPGLLASADGFRRVRVVVVPGGHLVGRMIEDLGSVSQALAFSHDGRLLFAGLRDRTCVAYALDARRVEARMRGHRGWVTAVAPSPDGGSLLTASRDGTARLWDLGSHQTRHVLEGHAGELTAAAWAPRGGVVATCSSRGEVHLWGGATGERLRALRGHRDGVRALAFSPDGSMLASGGDDGSLRLWSVATGEVLRSQETGHGVITGLAFLGQEASLASAGSDGTLRLWRHRD